MNQQGTVGLDIEVSPQGTVNDVKVVKSSGYDTLDAAAILCAKQWTYRPAMRNGAPVAGRTQARVAFSLAGGRGHIPATITMPSPPLWSPLPPPQGWSREASSVAWGGIVAAYKLPASTAASDQYLSAGLYANFATLDGFIVQHDSAFRGVAEPGTLVEHKLIVCGDVPAWEAEYSRAGLIPTASDQMLTIRQVAVVSNGDAYIATYIRPAGTPVRADADEWIHSYCK